MKNLFPLLGAALLFSGCHWGGSSRKPPPAPEMSIARGRPDPAQAAAAAVPSSPPVGSAVSPMSVYRPPVIRKVYLAPYTDENGNAYGPQVKYVVDDPGGWNMDAVANPSKAYIPPAMAPSVTQPGSYVVPNTGETPEPTPSKALRDLYDINTVVVTGFIERSQEPLAREQAAKLGEKYLPYFDENLGWVLLPRSALQPIRAK